MIYWTEISEPPQVEMTFIVSNIKLLQSSLL